MCTLYIESQNGFHGNDAQISAMSLSDSLTPKNHP